MEERTIFHDIRDKKVPADIVYEDDEVVVFNDIHPAAPTHILFVPKQFASSVKDLTPEQEHLPGMLVLKAKEFADKNGIDGYKLEFHVGRGGGQVVFYLHLHLLSQQKIRGN